MGLGLVPEDAENRSSPGARESWARGRYILFPWARALECLLSVSGLSLFPTVSLCAVSLKLLRSLSLLSSPSMFS